MSYNSVGSSDAPKVLHIADAIVVRGFILIFSHSYQGLESAFGLLCAVECFVRFYVAVGFSFERYVQHSNCFTSFQCCIAQKVD